MNWTPGPHRCRSPEYEAEIAFTDMGGDYPTGGRVRNKGRAVWLPGRWAADGSWYIGHCGPLDLMPPAITREVLTTECVRVYYAIPKEMTTQAGMEEVVAHVIDAVKAGRVE